ncbi:DUF305 domain-containing protein, partial [Actinoplanes siamensis]
APAPGAAAPAPVAPSAQETAYVAGMAEHHRQALRLVAILRGRPGVPERIGNLAEHLAAVQAAEAADMSGFLDAWAAEPMAGEHAHHHAQLSGVLPEERVRALGGVSGAAAGRLFLQLMIAHHEGAVEMSEGVLPAARNPWVISLARHVVAEQRVETGAMRRILALR